MGRVKLLFLIMAFMAPAVVFGQAPARVVNLQFYTGSLRYQYDLSSFEGVTYMKVDYLPTGNPGSYQQITGITFTDVRPSTYTSTIGGWASNPVSESESVYFYYTPDDDTVTYCSNYLQSVLDYLDEYNLGSPAQRRSAYNTVKGIADGSAIPFTPLVTITPQALLAPLAGFVTSGLGIGVSVTLLSIFIINLVLNRRKSLVRASARENKDIAKETGLSRKRVENLRDDNAVLDRSVRGSMSFRDYA